MRRVILLGPAYPLRGGLAAFNERLAQAFQAQGDEVKLYTFSLQYPDFLFPGKTQFSDDFAPANLEIKVVMNSINPVNWWSVGRQLAKEEADLIVCAFWLPFMAPCLGTILRLAARNKETKIIGLVHNMIPHEARPGDRLFSRYFVGANDGFVTLSKAVAEDVQQFDAEKPIASAPHPIYDSYGTLVPKTEAKARLQLKQEQRYLLFFGFIRDYKGLDLLIHALSDERVRALNVKLIVAGEFYGDPQPYQDLIDELGIREQLLLHTDFIPNEEVRYYFGAADLVVQPYKTATQSGISQLAYHFEKPMIVTNVGGLAEIVEDGKSGYVVEREPRLIADAIIDFYTEDRELELQEGVRAGQGRFTWEALVAKFEEVYKAI